MMDHETSVRPDADARIENMQTAVLFDIKPVELRRSSHARNDRPPRSQLERRKPAGGVRGFQCVDPMTHTDNRPGLKV